MELANSGDAGGAGDGGAAGAGVAAELFGGGGAGGDQGGQGAAGGDGGKGAAAGDGSQAGAGDGGQGVVDPDWYTQVSEAVIDGENASNRDLVKAKGWKTLDDVVKSYREAERGLRESGRIKVPGEGAKPEEIAAFHKAIGVPDDAKGYGLPELKNAAGEAVKLNEPLLERLAGVAHKSGVPKAAYEALVSDFVQSQLEEAAIADQAEQTEAKDKLKEWGGQANAKLGAIDAAASALGLTREELVAVRGALGAGRSMDLLAKLGEGIAEDTILTGGANKRFGITAAQAQEELNKLKTNPAIMVKGSAERARYDRLQDIIGAEANRKAAAGE